MQYEYVDRFHQKSNENKKVLKPYFNECILAAERMKNNRRSERDRKICYENLILAQKLERIKKQSGQNYRNHCRLLISKTNCEPITKRFITKQSLLSNKKRFDFNEEKCSETIITSYHSPSPIQSESETQDDQATVADVDASMDYCDSTLPTKCKEIHSLKNQSLRIFGIENDRVYQHLNNIDMTMIRDTMPLPTSQTSKHFSICILPHFDSDVVKPMNNHSKVLSHDRQYAFKKEILYH